MAAHALVEVHDGGPMGKTTYTVPDATVEMLRKIDGPVAIVAIAGIYRSGKSFLLNCLAQPDREDATPLFEVGPTINACTRGLWIWPTAMTVPQPDGTWLAKEIPGPANITAWKFCFRVYRVACVMQEIMPEIVLQKYEQLIETLAREWPECWHLV